MVEKDFFLKVFDIYIDGCFDEVWYLIIKGVSFELCKGEVMGLIGEFGVGKFMLGLVVMGYMWDGCKIMGGKVEFDGVDLVMVLVVVKCGLFGKCIVYVV